MRHHLHRQSITRRPARVLITAGWPDIGIRWDRDTTGMRASGPDARTPAHIGWGRDTTGTATITDTGAANQAALSCGWLGARFTQRYAAMEFFQKYFSAAAGPLAVKYSRTTLNTCGYGAHRSLLGQSLP